MCRRRSQVGAVMQNVTPLPDFLIERYREWQAQMSKPTRSKLATLAVYGQRPRAMIVACCDSRVMVTDVFGGEAGDFFVHRNIANLVPPCTADDAARGTSATIEYAVKVLNIDHLIVMGHFGCGGVAGCLDMLSHRDGAPDPESFVGKWLTILEPGYDRVAAQGLDRIAGLRAMEHQAILVSLENLMTFPFVRAAVEATGICVLGCCGWLRRTRFFLERRFAELVLAFMAGMDVFAVAIRPPRAGLWTLGLCTLPNGIVAFPKTRGPLHQCLHRRPKEPC